MLHETPYVIVGKVSDTRRHEQFSKELDSIADLLVSKGENVLRSTVAWPRNYFFSEPFKLISRDSSAGSLVQDNVFGDYGLFMSSEDLIVMSEYALNLKEEKRISSLTNELFAGKKEYLIFNTSPIREGIIRYPGLNNQGIPIRDLDYVANWIPSRGIYTTYKWFMNANKQSLEYLENIGFNELVFFPDDEFKSIAVNFEVFGKPDHEYVLMNSQCKNSIRMLRAKGIEVIPTSVPLTVMSSMIFSNSMARLGGGVRCSTNLLYPSSLPNENYETFRALNIEC